jgi:hypothetical protein
MKRIIVMTYRGSVAKNILATITGIERTFPTSKYCGQKRFLQHYRELSPSVIKRGVYRA